MSIRETLELRAKDTRCEETATTLMALDDERFDALVEQHINRLLPEDVADVLGHPIVVLRWSEAIRAKLAALAAEYAAHKGERWARWRVAAKTREARLVELKAAAKHARIAASTDPREKEMMAGRGKPDRKGAWEIAVQKLIDAHRDEWLAYYHEELDRTREQDAS